MRRNRKTHPILFWEECLAVLVYRSMMEGELEYSSSIIYELLGEFTLETTEPEKRGTWWAQKIRNVKSALGDGPPSANEGTLIHIRRANELLSSNPSDAIALARKALIKPFPEVLEEKLFKTNSFVSILAEPSEKYQSKGSLEGTWRLVLHVEKERDSALTRQAKKNFRLTNSDQLFCEACTINPEQYFGMDVIEAHHRVPLSALDKPRLNTTEDFIMLCPNCHRMIHKIENCDFEQLKSLVNGQLRLHDS